MLSPVRIQKDQFFITVLDLYRCGFSDSGGSVAIC